MLDNTLNIHILSVIDDMHSLDMHQKTTLIAFLPCITRNLVHCVGGVAISSDLRRARMAWRHQSAPYKEDGARRQLAAPYGDGQSRARMLMMGPR